MSVERFFEEVVFTPGRRRAVDTHLALPVRTRALGHGSALKRTEARPIKTARR